MTFWHALNAGTRSFQQGVNFVGNSVDQVNQLRREDEQVRENRITSALRRDMLTNQQVPTVNAPQVQVPPQEGAGSTPGVNPPAPQETGQAWQTGESPPAQPAGEAAPAQAPTGEPSDEDRIRAGIQAHIARWNGGRSATGTPVPDETYVRNTLTGRGTVAPNALVQGMRTVSGNTSNPLGPRDLAAYMAEGERRLAAAGLGHRVDEWRGRVMQNIQSAAARTAAVAAAQAEAGDLNSAARTLATAYGFVPDGMDVRVGQGPDGRPVAQRIGPDGQPVGSPMPLTPQVIREMAIGVAEPTSLERLLLARQEMGLRERALDQQMQIARMRAAGGGGGGRAGGRTTPLSLADQRALAEMQDPILEQGLAEARTSMPRGSVIMPPNIATALARDMGASGYTTADQAAQIAVGAATGRNRIAVGPNGSMGIVYGGSIIPLSPATGALLRQYMPEPSATGAGAAPPPPPGVRRNQTPPPALPAAPRE